MELFSYAVLTIVIAMIICFFVINTLGADSGDPQKDKDDADTVTVTLAQLTGEREYSIKGINKRGLDDSFLGDFVGTARALKSNPYDPYAIGVYIGSRHIGYFPRDNKELHALLISVGGYVDVEGYVAKGVDDDEGYTFYYGKVWFP